MVSLAIGCSTLFVITVYISGVESYDADTPVENSKKKQEQTQHDISVYFRPMLGKRASYFIPRLGKRAPEDDDTPSDLWEIDSSDKTGVVSSETEASKDQPDAIQHPLMVRWYTPRLGKRASYTPGLGNKMSYYTPRLGKRMSYYTPRLGKRDTEDNDIPCSLWRTEDTSEYDFPKERRGGRKEDKVWKMVGMFNPRLGRSAPSDILDSELAREHLKNIVNFSPDKE